MQYLNLIKDDARLVIVKNILELSMVSEIKDYVELKEMIDSLNEKCI